MTNTLSPDAVVHVNPAIRLIPPSSLTDDQWFVESYVACRRWRVSLPGIMLLAVCAGETELAEAVEIMSVKSGLLASRITDLLLQLWRAGLLIIRERDVQDDATVSVRDTLLTWAQVGWSEAAEYHLSTFDYPFVDYAHGGRQVDTERMREYVADEPDESRYKRYNDATSRIRLPATDTALLPESVGDGLKTPCGLRLDRDRLMRILSATCGETATVTSGRWPRAPMVRRTSPSGGARHPTETYILVLDVASLPAAWYHVTVNPPELELMREVRMSEEELRRIFPLGFARVPIEPKAIAVMTSVFSRNMFRYREPRTFRTVHMDAGHLASTMAIAASAVGVRAHVAYGDHERLIEDALGISCLNEGYLLSVSLGTPKARR
ncbi:MAG TPA: SagB/ThcOx family dehydrogenase [Solirubrobacteraceae bacterium]|nr:SagB/ThcOx family dehydrogenase [Solirubrobacteraceae bacterium]